MYKWLRIHVEEDLHRQVRHAAIDQGQTITEWVISALLQKLGKEVKKDEES